MLRETRPHGLRRRVARTGWNAVLCAVVMATASCGGYSGPPDIETARQGLPPEYRLVTDGVDGKSALELLRDNAESIETEGDGDQVLVTAINGIESGVEGRYWLFYVNGQAAQVSATQIMTVEGDSIEWLFAR